MNKTLFDKVWDNHLVSSIKNGPDILYIDKHLIHEVTSPQAFDILKERKIKPIKKPIVFGLEKFFIKKKARN